MHDAWFLVTLSIEFVSLQLFFNLQDSTLNYSAKNGLNLKNSILRIYKGDLTDLKDTFLALSCFIQCSTYRIWLLQPLPPSSWALSSWWRQLMEWRTWHWLTRSLSTQTLNWKASNLQMIGIHVIRYSLTNKEQIGKLNPSVYK